MFYLGAIEAGIRVLHAFKNCILLWNQNKFPTISKGFNERSIASKFLSPGFNSSSGRDDKLFPSFLSGKVYFVTWLLLKCNCRHYLLPEKNLNQDRVPFCKRIHSSVATLLKAGTTIWNAMSYIILEVRLDMHRSFLISTFMKPEGKNRQITFA